MTSKTRSFRLSPATIISCVALFLALTGSAFAVGVAKNSVRSAQIANGTIRTVDLRANAVKAAKIAPGAVGAEELAESSVGSPAVIDESLTAADLGAASVTSSEIADGSVRSSELGTVVQRQSAVQAIAAGANGSVSVSCAAGEQILSGGGQPGNFGVEMTSSRPAGNGWLYQAKNNTGGASTISAFALCLAG